MDPTSALSHISEVLDKLSDQPEALNICLAALKHSDNGQMKLSSGDSKEALKLLHKAHDGFKKIPDAKYMLGICKQDIAAANANLGNFFDAIKYAEGAISLIGGVSKFAFTEAMAHMTLGNSYYMTGEPKIGKDHFYHSKCILESLPGIDRKYIDALNRNVALLRYRIPLKIGCLLLTIIVIGLAVVIYIFVKR